MPTWHLRPIQRDGEGNPVEQPPRPEGGPGTELKQLIRWFTGVRPDGATCGCQAHVESMDQNGPAWVEANQDIVLSWLKDGAARLGVPFFEGPAKWAIYIAIQRAKAKGFK